MRLVRDWRFGPRPLKVEETVTLPDSLLLLKVRFDKSNPPGAWDDGARLISAASAKTEAKAWTGEIEEWNAVDRELTVRTTSGADAPSAPDASLPLWLCPFDFCAPAAAHLESLREAGEGDKVFAEFSALKASLSAVTADTTEARKKSPEDLFVATLRPSQAASVVSAERPVSIVWGPPGTGKTHTLGHIVAHHVAQGRRVLMLSLTNAAVDCMTVAAYDAFKRTKVSVEPGTILRVCRTLTQPEAFEKRSELLHYSAVLKSLNDRQRENYTELARVRDALQGRPDEAERIKLTAMIPELKKAIEALGQERRRILEELIRNARVLALTHTSAMFRGILTAGNHFDTLVVDEASQIPLAAWPVLLSAGFSSIVVAGDPCQLRPISPEGDGKTKPTKQEQSLVNHWFARSLYEHIGLDGGPESDFAATLSRAGSLNFLAVQNRMNAELCAAVSRVFYDGRLEGENTDGAPPWISAAALPSFPLGLLDKTGAPPAPASGTGNTDPAAVKLVMRKLETSLNEWRRQRPASPLTVRIVTPFRNQADLYKTALAKLRKSLGKDKLFTLVSGTVHTAQGSEADVVIIDPVDSQHAFCKTMPGSRNLWCVAASRARLQCLVVETPANVDATDSWASKLLRDAPRG